jgi:MFS family permease
MDAYDMAMVIVLAPILSKIFTSPKLSEAGQFLMVALLYAVTLVARPLGAAVFGHYADKIGRRSLLVVTIGGVGVMSVLCGLIPTPDKIGWQLDSLWVAFLAVRLLSELFLPSNMLHRGCAGLSADLFIQGFPSDMQLPLSRFWA